MFRSGIKIARDPAMLSITETASGAVRITSPRAGRALAAALLLAAGVGGWLALLPEDPWGEPTVYAIGLLFATPGLLALGKAARPRPVVRIRRGELVAWYGLAFVERLAVRLPLDGLEVRVRPQVVEAVRQDAHSVTKRLFSMLNPLPSGGAADGEIKLHVLEVRTRGQEQWLGLLGSQVASEVENARLAIAAAAGGEGEGEDADVEIEDED